MRSCCAHDRATTASSSLAYAHVIRIHTPASPTDSARGDQAGGLDPNEVASEIEHVIEQRKGPRPLPDNLQGRYEYFLELSGTAAWSRIDDKFSGAKNLPFDVVDEEQVYSDMLERAISMVEGRIPG
jgi:hypothetical protein